MFVLLIVVCPFVLFLLTIVLSVLLRYVDSDCTFVIFKLFLHVTFQQFYLCDVNIATQMIEISACDAL
jgi:hypothetical protein